MLLIAVSRITSRLKYVLKFIFQENAGIAYQIVTTLPKNTGASILEYKAAPSGAYPFIQAHRLLFDETVTAHQSPAGSLRWKAGMPQLFAHVTDDLMGFDVFAAVFYMISRYEEYIPFTPDRHGRFPATASLAYKKGFLEMPVTDQWIKLLLKRLQKAYPGLSLRPAAFRILPTFDIDNAYAYKHKPVSRQLGAIARSVVKREGQELIQRIKVITGRQCDPYAQYSRIIKLYEKARLKPVFFFLLSNYSTYDKNLSWRNRAYQNLIQNIHNQYYTGIHPGYHAASSAKKLNDEIRRLQEITSSRVHRARYHYLLIRFPYSFRMLEQAGITEDYSLGFPDYPGFRAGTCFPFHFFDLKRNQECALKMYPFAFMDATLQFYHKASAQQALNKALQLMQKAREANAYFTMLWHNEAFSGKGIWQGWPEVCTQILEKAGSL